MTQLTGPDGSPAGSPESLAESFTEAADVLRQATRVLVTAHVAPDGDAVGSVLALVRGLRSVGVDATGVLPDRDLRPRQMASLLDPGLLVGPGDALDLVRAGACQVLVCLDSSSPDRLGELARVAAEPPDGLRVVVVDHHRTGKPYGEVRVVDPAAPATVVLVARLLDVLGAELAPTATALYLGLASDTGFFRFSSTNAQAHELAARLITAGVRPDEVADVLSGPLPYASVRLTGRIVGRLVLEPAPPGSPSLVWSSVSADELAEHGVEPAELDRVIDVIRMTEEADAAMFLLQAPDGSWRVSLRSGGAVDVSAVCAALGGGGHARAAGFTSRLTLVKTVGEVRRRLAGGAGNGSRGSRRG